VYLQGLTVRGQAAELLIEVLVEAAPVEPEPVEPEPVEPEPVEPVEPTTPTTPDDDNVTIDADVLEEITSSLNETKTEMALTITPSSSSMTLSFDLSTFLPETVSSSFDDGTWTVSLDDGGSKIARYNSATSKVDIDYVAVKQEDLTSLSFSILASSGDSLQIMVVTLDFNQDESDDEDAVVEADSEMSSAGGGSNEEGNSTATEWTASANSNGEVTIEFDRAIVPINPGSVSNSTLKLSLGDSSSSESAGES